jgi:hypothetical protein
MFTVGISVALGAGNVGFGPVPAETGRVATSAQALSVSDKAATKSKGCSFMKTSW